LAEQAGASRVVAALDARMNETYFAAYERDGLGWRAAIEPCLCDSQRMPDLEGDGWTAIGSGFDRHGYVREHCASQVARTLADRLPGAREIVRIAAAAFEAGRAVEPEFAAPLYIRDKVAMTIEERAALRRHKDAEAARS
jgi:tRNA threonylcarbamoyladenosine biosynthesis protein TsaB